MSGQPAESKLNTVTIPQIGAGDPALLYSAANRVLRIVVSNVGGNTIFLSHDSSTLQQVQLAGVYQLLPGQNVTVVLMPRQSISAAGAGPAGIVSMAVSEAIPMTWGES